MLPRWRLLNTELQQSVVALLTRMLQQHLSPVIAIGEREVADDGN
jgi:hypothetical protein